MSTRATYLLAASHWSDQSVCIYIHHDGYLKGAASYFWLMHLNKNDSGGYAGQFFRANENAEFTTGHDAYSDTEYRYTLDAKGNLKAWKREISGSLWKLVFRGTWYDFVNKYCEESETLYYFKTSQFSEHGVVMTIKEAEMLINENKIYASEALSHGHVGNANYANRQANYLQSQLDQIYPNIN